MSFQFNEPDFKPEAIHQSDDRLTNVNLSNSRYNRRKRQRQRQLKAFLVFIALLIIIGLISGVVVLINKQSKTVKKSPIIKTAVIKQYISTSSSINFSYPDNWTVFNNHHGLIEINSPVTSILNDLHHQTKGRIDVMINQKTVIPPQFGNFSLAVLNSKIVKYKKPTSLQSNQTYLTFAQYPSTTVIGGLNAIYLTGSFGYEFKQVIPIGDMEKLSPLIIISFNQCINKNCHNVTPMVVNSSFVNQPIVSQQAYNIVESIQIT